MSLEAGFWALKPGGGWRRRRRRRKLTRSQLVTKLIVYSISHVELEACNKNYLGVHFICESCHFGVCDSCLHLFAITGNKRFAKRPDSESANDLKQRWDNYKPPSPIKNDNFHRGSFDPSSGEFFQGNGRSEAASGGGGGGGDDGDDGRSNWKNEDNDGKNNDRKFNNRGNNWRPPGDDNGGFDPRRPSYNDPRQPSFDGGNRNSTT